MYDLSTLRETCNCGDPACFAKECPTKLIPDFGLDHNYADSAEQGENSATNHKNQPAIDAAKTAGGVPFPQTVDNGINATAGKKLDLSDVNPKFRDIVNGREEDSYQQESVCDVLSRLSYR